MVHPAPLVLKVNGNSHSLEIDPATILLYVLRNDLRLNGPKYGCGLGQCGACMILVDRSPVRACITPLHRVLGKEITTLEGLGSAGQLHPVQAAFIECQATQCGYCLNGMVIAVTALVDRASAPSEDEIKEALRFNLCRCGAHIEIIRAAMLAASKVWT